MKPKVLITGGGGYVGTNLITKLSDWEVYVMDLVPPKVPVHHYYQQNICDPQVPEEHYNCVVHLAALVKVGESYNQEPDYWRVNVGGTLNLVEQLHYDHFLFASTSQAGYHNPYSLTKLVGEKIVGSTPHHSIMRFSNVVGGVNLTNYQSILANINHHTFKIYGDNWNTPDRTAVRDYVWVVDVVNHIVQRLDQPTNSVEVLGSGVGYSVLDIIKMNQEITGYPKEILYTTRRSGDIEDNVVTPSPTFVNTKNIREILHEHSISIRPPP